MYDEIPQNRVVGEELELGSIMLNTTKSNIVEEAAAASVVQVAEETGSFYTEEADDEEGYDVGATVQLEAEVVANVDEAADGVAADDDDGGGGPTVMSRTEYVVAYKRLCESEINDTLSWQRKPFESTAFYKDMVADSSTTKEDLEREAAEHEFVQDQVSAWQDRVRREYTDKGFVAVDDDYIADRLEVEQHCKETFARMFAELRLDDAMFAEE